MTTIYKFGSYKDDVAKGFLSMWCKGIPQLWMAYVIYQAGSSEGLPTVSLIASHITSFPRFLQVWINAHQGGWDRSTKGLFIGELGNVITWAIVTVMWFIMR
ncbi:hypothetical protein KKH39_03460 [Patescibacteria group bacterium]|nr:hypothetical protein [Patescibacteria group bacterium]